MDQANILQINFEDLNISEDEVKNFPITYENDFYFFINKQFNGFLMKYNFYKNYLASNYTHLMVIKKREEI